MLSNLFFADDSVNPFTVLPHVNAALNSTATVLILLGLLAIKAGREGAHKLLMLLAASASAAFLACYLVYHAQVGSVKFEKPGLLVNAVYYVILVTHILLAAVQLPMILRTIWLGIRIDRVVQVPELNADLRARHRRLAKITAPIWLYVSVTGVVVYWMLYWM